MAFISNYISINNTTLPTPTSYRVQMADLDTENTTRDETGVLHRDRIRYGVYKIIAQWRLTTTQLSSLISLLQNASFSVTFFDPNTLTYQTKTMYAGDRESEIVVGNASTSAIYVDFNVDLIEL